MGDHPQAPTQYEFGNGDPGRFLNSRLKPLPIFNMSRRILPMRVNEDIHIKEFHECSIISDRADADFKSTPGIVPVPPKVLIGLLA